MHTLGDGSQGRGIGQARYPTARYSKHRVHVTPARRGKGRKALSGTAWKDKTQAERHIAMT
jgi:hypothetical protein